MRTGIIEPYTYGTMQGVGTRIDGPATGPGATTGLSPQRKLEVDAFGFL